MSNLMENDGCIPDTQETYYEGASESTKEEVITETQKFSLSESQDFHLVDSEGEESVTERSRLTQDGKNNCQESINQDLQTWDASQLKANDKEDATIKDKELEEDSVKNSEKEVSSDVLHSEKNRESSKEDTSSVPPSKSSPSPETIGNAEVADLKVESDEQSLKTPKTITSEDVIVEHKDKENEDDKTQELVDNKSVERIGEDISGSNVPDSKTKDELSDEDEVIQATPPQTCLSTKSTGSKVTSLKRKAGCFDGPPIKLSKIMSAEETSSKRFDDEESRQSCESDDSYQDLFKNNDKNIIIEETQDPTNQELVQDSLRSPLKHTTDDDKTQEHCFEQSQDDNVFSTKCCDMEKDENLNVSTKLSDTSANDSTVVNANSMNESHLNVEDNNLSVEAKENISVTSITDEEVSKVEVSIEADKSAEDLKTTSEKEKTEGTSYVESTEKIIDKNDKETSITQAKASVEASLSVKSLSRPRFSVELIHEISRGSKPKPELVQIDEDGEKIVLDSSTEMTYDRKSSSTANPEIVEIVDDSHEDRDKIVPDKLEGLEVQVDKDKMYKSHDDSKTTSDINYKSAESMKESSLDSKSTTDRKLVNGSSESKKCDTDATLSIESDTFSGCDTPFHPTKDDSNIAALTNTKKFMKGVFLGSKDLDNNELISISDNEISNVEEKNKSDLLHNSALAKAVQMEREIEMYVKIKCTLHMDESTKEFLSKELIQVQCEPAITESASIGKQKNEDSQSSLADISDNKESSPGSVTSNAQPYQMNPSRLSILSSISSTSSASSAASLAARINLKNHFSMPLGPAKHAKKHLQDVSSTLSDKQALDETYERLTREWKNHRVLVTSILNCINTDLCGGTAVAAAAAPMDAYVNVSNERLDDHHHPHHHLLDENTMRSSTPEVAATALELVTTPKTTKKNKGIKRARSKPTKSNIAQTNGEQGDKNTSDVKSASEVDANTSPNRKKLKVESMSDNLPVNDVMNVPANSSPQDTLVDDLIDKNVFAKWSDNNYYPGVVSDRIKTKYKVNFYDGKSKMLIPEFVIPIPKILKEGLSVYATTKTNDYGSCGIIVDVQAKPNDEDAYYTVETDEGERLRVEVRDLFLSTDQAQVLKEELNSEDKNSLPSTPKALGQVTLENMVEGKRRSKRIGTPVFSTPKSRSNVRTNSSASKTKAEPSVSGVLSKPKKERLSENESMSSDVDLMQTEDDEYALRGVQREIIGTPYEQIVKGPQSRIKGKPRSKKKVEDEKTIATLGPIPPANSNIFKGMSFILTCISMETYRSWKQTTSTLPSTASSVEATETEETDNEDEWMERPFVRERLHAQIRAGGGKVYEDFDQIPKEEYKNTKLITNVPNTTVKSILCLSVGIPACNHKWIIRCCLEGKIVNVAEDVLPTGWSLQKNAYVEIFETAGNKPLSNVIVIIPFLIYDKEYTTFWRQVCENAGAVVLIAESSDSMEIRNFINDIVVVSNRKCPSWAVDTANKLQIPVLSTTWVVQCLIEGKQCPYEQSYYRYNFKTSISLLPQKRLFLHS